MTRGWAPLAVLLASACTNMPAPIESSGSAHPLTDSSERYVIAAVDNSPSAFVASAGSTPHGYGAVAGYGPGVAARRMMRSVERDFGLREVTAWPIKPLHLHCAVLEIPAGAARDDLLTALAHDRRIKLAQPLQLFATRTAAYNDPYVGLQHGFAEMDVAGAHQWSRGEGVKVAVIDTGADTEHPDLRGNIATAINFVDSDARQFRNDRHGTEMAGVIAAVADNLEGIVGIAPKARLLVFKACWQARPDSDAASCNSFTLALALVAALDARAQIINLSVVGPPDPLLSGLIHEGMLRGVLFVAAASPGTSSNDGGLSHQPGVIEVVSSGNPAEHGSALHAPGREILTLLPGGHYDFASGDSIATAQVSGVLALLLARKPALSAANAYRLLRDTSLHSAGVGGDATVIDACTAVTSLTGTGVCVLDTGRAIATRHQ